MKRLVDVCVLLVVAAAIVLRFQPRSSLPPSGSLAALTAERDTAWADLRRAAVPVGGRGGLVSIVVFNDLECPFCAILHAHLREEVQRNPITLSVEHVHFPIAGHRFAIPAAIALECTRTHGVYGQMLDTLFSRQARYGLESFTSLARSAGVRDTAAFSHCTDTLKIETSRIERNRLLGLRLRVRATPTIYIDGWRLSRPPSQEELAKAIQRVSRGQAPTG